MIDLPTRIADEALGEYAGVDRDELHASIRAAAENMLQPSASPRRLARLRVLPNDAVPDDAAIVGCCWAGQWLSITLEHSEFPPVFPGDVIPDLDPPVIQVDVDVCQGRRA